MDMSRNKQREDDDGNILIKEIKSWEHFEYAMMEENRLLFSKMLSECRENEDYARDAISKDEEYFQLNHYLWS
jgi:hypothetical protein